MILSSLFLSKKNYTAQIAKKRLKKMIQEQRNTFQKTDFLLSLKNDLLLVINKYIKIQPNLISIQITRTKKKTFQVDVNIPTSI